MTIEINKELVVNISHITEECSEFIEKSGSDYSADQSAFRIHTGMETNLWGSYEELDYLIILAREMECKWLVIDNDGPEVGFLPTFEW